MHSLRALELLAEELIAKSDRILEYTKNKDATGLHRERVVEAFIKRLAPDAFGFGSGFISMTSESSSQVDVLVYDKLNFAPLFDEGGFIVVSPEAVIEIIEVKSKLDSNSISSALDNVVSATRLNPKIQGSVFAFDGMLVATGVKHIEEYVHYQFKKNPNIIYQLPQFIVNLKRKWLSVRLLPKKNELKDFLLSLGYDNRKINGLNLQDFIKSVLPMIPNEQDRLLVYMFNNKSEDFIKWFSTYFHAPHYKMYGYQRKLQTELPSLASQGFPLDFSPGEADIKIFIPAKRKQ